MSVPKGTAVDERLLHAMMLTAKKMAKHTPGNSVPVRKAVLNCGVCRNQV